MLLPEATIVAGDVDVLIVSALATVRAGLAAVLAGTGDLRLAGQGSALDAESFAEALSGVDVVLLDAPSAIEVDDAITVMEGLGPGLAVLGPPSAAGRLSRAAPRSPGRIWHGTPSLDGSSRRFGP